LTTGKIRTDGIERRDLHGHQISPDVGVIANEGGNVCLERPTPFLSIVILIDQPWNASLGTAWISPLLRRSGGSARRFNAVAERSREIATMRAVGFGASSVVLSFVFEALLISLVGGLLGCVAVLPLNGLTTGAMNWQTFSHLAFAFRITPVLLLGGIVFALGMGLLGGVPPAIRAARRPLAAALRAL